MPFLDFSICIVTHANYVLKAHLREVDFSHRYSSYREVISALLRSKRLIEIQRSKAIRYLRLIHNFKVSCIYAQRDTQMMKSAAAYKDVIGIGRYCKSIAEMLRKTSLCSVQFRDRAQNWGHCPGHCSVRFGCGPGPRLPQPATFSDRSDPRQSA